MIKPLDECMLDTIITSKTRIKLLLKFFLNSQTKSYLRNLEQEFGESSNAIRIELNRLEEAGLLKSEVEGNRKFFRANVMHPLFNDINSILRKITGIDSVVERVIRNIGNLESAYVTGEFARGIDSNVIELLLVGNNLDSEYVKTLVDKAEDLINRRIHFLILSSGQIENYFDKTPKLLVWKSE